MRVLLPAILIFFTFLVKGQVTFVPFQQRSNINFERKIYEHAVVKHPSIQQWVHTLSEDSLRNLDKDRWQKKRYKSWVGRKFLNEDFIKVDTGNFRLRINPLLNLQLGGNSQDTSSRLRSSNTRGLMVEASVGNKFGFYTSFWENQSFFPRYLDQYTRTSGAVPGQGRTKPFKQTGFDYARASAVMHYQPKKWLMLQAGHGKNFYGNGYRSLLLSDFAFNYPFLKVGFSMFNGKLLYQPSFAALQNLERLPATGATEAQFVRKAGTFHILHFEPNKRFEIGFFEAGIWRNWDTAGTVPLPVNYFLPVPLLNSGINGLEGHNYKGIVGFNARVNPFEKVVLYSQFVIGQRESSKYAAQFGGKWFDAFSLENLFIQAEYNSLDQGLYEHRDSRMQFDHYNEGLANFFTNVTDEIILRANYSFRDIFVSLKYNQHRKNTTVSSSSGAVSIKSNVVNQVSISSVEVGYLFNSSRNFMLVAGVQERRDNLFKNGEDAQWVYLALRTELQNLYFDF